MRASRKRGFSITAIAAFAVCGAIAAPASATPMDSVGVSPFNYTAGVAGQAQITLVNSSTGAENAEFESVSLFPGCATTIAYCVPSDTARDVGLFTLSATGTGSGTPNNCNGSWEIVQTSANPVRWALVPGRIPFLEIGPNESCTVSFTATASRLPTVDVNPVTPGVQTNFVLDAHVYYLNGPIHDTSNFAEVTVFPGAPPGAGGAAGATGRQAAALKKCKKKHSKKKRRKCRKKAKQLPL
jgi:hypothetical protein